MVDTSLTCRCACPRCSCLCMLFFRDRRTHTLYGKPFFFRCSPSFFDSVGRMCTVLSMGPSLSCPPLYSFSSSLCLSRLLCVGLLSSCISLSFPVPPLMSAPPHSSPLTSPTALPNFHSTHLRFVCCTANHEVFSRVLLSHLPAPHPEQQKTRCSDNEACMWEDRDKQNEKKGLGK